MKPWNRIKAARLITIDRKDSFNDVSPVPALVSLGSEMALAFEQPLDE